MKRSRPKGADHPHSPSAPPYLRTATPEALAKALLKPLAPPDPAALRKGRSNR